VTRLNWIAVRSNLSEAREELQKLERMVAGAERRSEVGLEIGLGHAYHHLNFAWHVRRIPMSQ
jgi:hypothetical protein